MGMLFYLFITHFNSFYLFDNLVKIKINKSNMP